MKQGNTTLKTIVSTALLLLSLVAGGNTLADNRDESKTKIIKFDVVENVSRFIFAKEPVFDDGFPAHGNSFITEGYIYPVGFLNDNPGVTEDGNPTHPEKVLGKWTCRGFFVGKAAHATTGPMVITTQTYDLFDEPGYTEGQYSTNKLLISEGYEIVDTNTPISRAITGGTGPFSRSQGIVIQNFLGFNEYMGVRQRFTVKLAGK